MALLSITLAHFSPTAQDSDPTGTADTLLQHQISGIADPSNSTLSGHLSRTFGGISSAFSLPFGHGTGSVTQAASRLGGTSNVGTEYDLGNTGEALGLPGLTMYLVVVVLGLLASYRLASRRRDFLALASFGLLVVTLFQWLNGDLYSVAWLTWLCLGWIDHQTVAKGMPVRELPVLKSQSALVNAR